MDYPKLRVEAQVNIPRDSITVDVTQLMRIKCNSDIITVFGASMRPQVRVAGDLAERGFVLPDDFDWVIVKDNYDYTMLVPLKRIPR
jgi:hypothetical protein